MELASCFVLYATAFVAIVQIGPLGAQRSITHLTLIAGFASTIFWPVTTWLHGFLDWRAVYFVFAGLNLLVCLPHPRLAARPVAAAAGACHTLPGGAAGPSRLPRLAPDAHPHRSSC